MQRLLVSLALCLPAGCGVYLPSTSSSKQAAKYPYEECPAVIEYLHNNLNDPSVLEIVDWKREETPVKDRDPDVFIWVTFRSMNRFGAKVLIKFCCRFYQGKLMGGWEV